jgi:hypothetical protein
MLLICLYIGDPWLLEHHMKVMNIQVPLGKCDCKAKYVRIGICDLGAISFKSQYLPKDYAYINF